MRTLTLAAALFVLACGGAPPEAPRTREPSAGSPATTALAPLPQPSPAAPIARCEPAPDRLCPVDQASQDPSFAAFREQLAGIVERRDAAALLRVVDPKIRTTFGEGGGSDDFRARWKLDSGDSPLWQELATILSHGGTFGGEGASKSFWAPYVFSAWPEEKDAFTHVAALGPGVAVRERGSADAPLIATVDWGILELVLGQGWSPEDPWYQVRLPDGRAGWVDASQVRMPLDWRAGFVKRDGEWKMNILVAGD